MSTAVLDGINIINERKILSISSKRQITIPQKYFALLGFGSEAECVFNGDELIIRPVRIVGSGEFAEQILEDLIGQGLSGQELLDEFKHRQAQIRPAVENMLAKARRAAEESEEFSTYDAVFPMEDE